MSKAAQGAKIAGGVLQAYGQYRQDKEMAKSSLLSAAWLDEQARFVDLATRRNIQLRTREAQELKGIQEAAFAANGLNFSGSAVFQLAQTETDMQQDNLFLDLQGRMQAAEARFQASQYRTTASNLKDPKNKLLKAAGTILGSL